MGLENFTATIDFSLLQPAHRRDRRERFRIERGSHEAALLELVGAPFDAVNTDVGSAALRDALRPLLDVPRMSTMAIGAILNRGVASMPAGHAFVNAGVWHGYTLLAAMAGNPDAVCVGIDDFSEFGGPRDEFGARFEAARSPRHTFYEMDYRDYLADVHDGPIGMYLYDGEDSYEGEFEALRAAEPYFAEGCILMADDTNRSPRRQAMLDFAEQSPHDYSVLLDVRTGANRHPTFWNGTMVLRRGRDGGTPEPAHVLGHDRQGPPPSDAPAPGPAPTVSVVLLPSSDRDAVARATEAIGAQTWPDTELVVAGSAAGLAQALERTSGELVSFVDCEADLRPDAIELSVAYPGPARFWHGRLESARLERLQSGVSAGKDVDSVLDPGTPFLLVSDHHGLPETLRAGPPKPLAEAPQRLSDVDAGGALNVLATAREAGIRHLVVLWTRFGWLDERPGVAAHLSQHATALLANDRVRVFALDGAA
jgi:Methyltransferase domain